MMPIPARFDDRYDPEPDESELDRRDARREPVPFTRPPTVVIDGWECWSEPVETVETAAVRGEG